MASRLWQPSSGAAPISPAFDASWTITTGFTRGPLNAVPAGTSGSTQSYTRAASAAATIVAVRQDVSPALPANKTITGNCFVAVPFRYSGDTSSVRARPRVVVRVVTPAGATRGTLLTAVGVDSSGYANYKTQVIGGAVTTVNALAGDYIVVERGFQFPTAAPASTTSATLFLGDPLTVRDTVDGDTSPAFDFRPWVEFSQDDIWGPVPRRVAGLATEVLDRSAAPSRRVAGAAVEVLDRSASPPRQVAGLAVEVLTGRAGQSLRRRIRSLGGVEPLVKVPGIGWRAVRPVPKPAEVPVAPPPLYLAGVITVATSAPTASFPRLRVGDVLVFSYVDGNSFASVAAGGPPTAVPGVVWNQVHSTSAPAGQGAPNPQSVAWIGVVTTDAPVLPANIAITAGGTDNATSLTAWRNLTGTLVGVGFATRNSGTPFTVTAVGAELNRHRAAILNVSGGTSIAITPTNPATGWVLDATSTAKFAFGTDPLDTTAGDVALSVTANAGLALSALLLVLE